MEKQLHENAAPPSLGTALSLILTNGKLFAYSAALILAMALLTFAGYSFALELLDDWISNFLRPVADAPGFWGWLKGAALLAGNWLYLLVSRTVIFYLAFLLAYTLTTPGYAFLSAAAEKIHAGELFDPDAALTPLGLLVDLWEGVKIALLGIPVTMLALILNFIPVIGQATVFLLYTYYSALLFFDYPASRRRWSLGRKLRWLGEHSSTSFRVGVLPALLSLLPFLNIFLMAMVFPLLTVYASLNFSAVELAQKRQVMIK